ncbi:hypothetical protein JQC92_22420 [Shewanella sp. 202IG2-18]|uniref:hypothetical protein n=1 Tax=Parashewanella hymeniacidonis TaxID=2807618 RepID=UPI00196215EB|nr:hypothetical protein [Parashewanella hymeniacidonis]MBM7074726.1 hypothetical protein [Parashewanella hymeniacidonis]
MAFVTSFQNYSQALFACYFGVKLQKEKQTMLAILSVAALMYAYFQACNELDKTEERDGHNKNSFLWFTWFGFFMRLQGLVTLFCGGYEYFSAGYSIEVLSYAIVGVMMFALSFAVLTKSKVGWFAATVFTCNPIFWFFNTVYYVKNKECFK